MIQLSYEIKMEKNSLSSMINAGRKKNVRVLVVGAGGIGCEVIKNLFKIKAFVLTLMDYDLISESNLNRQFCYRKTDINKFKVDVLYAYFKGINPHFEMTIERNNLFDFDSLYFSQFDILISALDNNDARKYLNLMAIDNNLPMIDAGTSGFNGQAMLFMRYLTQCRMCRHQDQPQMSHAVCTVRGKPQRNIHCIQFSINFYNSMANKWNDNEDEWSNGWASIEHHLQKYRKCEQLQQKLKICAEIHNLLFYENLINSEEDGIQPIQYSYQFICQDRELIRQTLNLSASTGQSIIQVMERIQNQQKLHIQQLSHRFYSYFFIYSLSRLLDKAIFNPAQQLTFDKDNFQSAFLIYSATNLKIANYKGMSYSKLNFMTFYECKDASGKIIPAIASTNSIAAALQVLLLNRLHPIGINRHDCSIQPAYISIKGFISSYKIQQYFNHKPKIGCSYCSPLYNSAQIFADFSKVSWGQLEDFLIQNFDKSLKKRDLRCGQFLIIRNSTSNSWSVNKKKLLNFNKRLILESKIGVNYIQLTYIDQQLRQNQFLTTWKFFVIMKSVENMEVAKGLKKSEYIQNIGREIERLKQRMKMNKQLESVSSDIIIQQ